MGLHSLVLCVCLLHSFILAKVLCCLSVHFKLVTEADPSLWLTLNSRHGWPLTVADTGWPLTVADTKLSPWLMLSSHHGWCWALTVADCIPSAPEHEDGVRPSVSPTLHTTEAALYLCCLPSTTLGPFCSDSPSPSLVCFQNKPQSRPFIKRGNAVG